MDKKVLSGIGMGCAIFAVLVLCCIGFMIFSGAVNYNSDPMEWDSGDKGLMTTLVVSTVCLLGFIIVVGGGSLWMFFKEREK